MNQKNILIIGYGNPGRGDDGLGPAFIELLGKELSANNNDDHSRLTRSSSMRYPKQNITLEEVFQLTPEDAFKLSVNDIVFFVDADMSSVNDMFVLSEVEPGEVPPYTSHALSAEYLLHLSQEIFGKRPEAYKLAIRGYSWEFGEDLTSKALQNLNATVRFFIKHIDQDRLPLK